MPSPRTARATGPNLRERFDAMRNLAPFLRQIWQTSRTLTVASLGLRVVRALMPVVTLYIGKLIIDEAIRLVLTRGRAGVLHAAGDTPLQALPAPEVPVRDVTGAGDTVVEAPVWLGAQDKVALVVGRPVHITAPSGQAVSPRVVARLAQL